MMWIDNYGNDLTWAIGLQMEGKLTRVEILGIIETHKINNQYGKNERIRANCTRCSRSNKRNNV